jgi:glutamate carboxypeptidase
MTEQAEKWITDQHDGLITTLKQWSNINSGSFNVDGVSNMADTIETYVQDSLGVTAERHALAALQQVDSSGNVIERPVGPLLKFSKRPDAKLRILFCGHMDTVFPSDSAFQQWHQLDNDTLGGPGVADMKGGILLMLTALQAFEQTPAAQDVGWDIVLNPDEEIGSIGSAPHLIAAAKHADLGLVFEPSMPDGYLAGARRGSGNYTLVVRGKSAHAGREYHLGRNAIATLARAMRDLDQLNSLRDSLTLNLAKIEGGGPNNVVPDHAQCHFNIRVTSSDDQAFAESHVRKVVESIQALDGFKVELHGGFTRPPKPATNQQKKLFELVQQCGQELNIELGFRDTGGCCDGNNLLAAGLPNIDTLGVQGGDIHSDKEYMLMSSLTRRAQLSHRLLQRVAAAPDRWLA